LICTIKSKRKNFHRETSVQHSQRREKDDDFPIFFYFGRKLNMSKATPLMTSCGLGEEFRIQDLIRNGKAGDVNQGDAKASFFPKIRSHLFIIYYCEPFFEMKIVSKLVIHSTSTHLSFIHNIVYSTGLDSTSHCSESPSRVLLFL
jgi:hypothetical protein